MNCEDRANIRQKQRASIKPNNEEPFELDEVLKQAGG
jgi:hypothetical protein